jgi:hypothetical protein
MRKSNFGKYVVNLSKKVNNSGFSTDNNRLENYRSLIIIMCWMFE